MKSHCKHLTFASFLPDHQSKCCFQYIHTKCRGSALFWLHFICQPSIIPKQPSFKFTIPFLTLLPPFLMRLSIITPRISSLFILGEMCKFSVFPDAQTTNSFLWHLNDLANDNHCFYHIQAIQKLTKSIIILPNFSLCSKSEPGCDATSLIANKNSILLIESFCQFHITKSNHYTSLFSFSLFYFSTMRGFFSPTLRTYFFVDYLNPASSIVVFALYF